MTLYTGNGSWTATGTSTTITSNNLNVYSAGIGVGQSSYVTVTPTVYASAYNNNFAFISIGTPAIAYRPIYSEKDKSNLASKRQNVIGYVREPGFTETRTDIRANHGTHEMLKGFDEIINRNPRQFKTVWKSVHSFDSGSKKRMIILDNHSDWILVV